MSGATNYRLVGRLGPDGTVLSWGHVNDISAGEIVAADGWVVLTAAQIAQMEAGTVLRHSAGVFTVVAPPAPDLAVVAARATRAIDLAAEQARLAALSPGSTMAYVYALKLSEASQALSDPSPQLSNYPLLSGDVGVTASTLLAAARLVVARAAQVGAWLGRVETVRLRAKAQVRVATSVDGINAALSAIAWPAGT